MGKNGSVGKNQSNASLRSEKSARQRSSTEFNFICATSLILVPVLEIFPRVEKILADQGDRGQRPQQITQGYKAKFELTTKLGNGFQVEPKRWIVGRTLAWLDNHRRLGRDDERYKCFWYDKAIIFNSMTVKQKIAVTLDQDLVQFLDAQARGNRSGYLSTLLLEHRERVLKEQTIAALQEDANDPEYLAELEAWDKVVGDGVDEDTPAGVAPTA